LNVSFFQELLGRISDRGRQLLDLSFISSSAPETVEDLCRALISTRGEASGVAIARQILQHYNNLDESEKSEFLTFLATEFVPSEEAIKAAARAYIDNPAPSTLAKLSEATEPPLQEFLRRLNRAPRATLQLVRMREQFLELAKTNKAVAQADLNFVHLFSSWFNRGFLVLQRIDWSTSASILEKIIQYEAVHEIKGWDDLRRRLDPNDRRCYAFFHPALVDEPLIFVEIALEDDIPGSIQALLESEGRPALDDAPPTTAVFYSISNCQSGLKGISFGNFLIKQVVEDLTREIPSLRTFVTLSPVPGFRPWLFRALDSGKLAYLSDDQLALLHRLKNEGWSEDEKLQDDARPVIRAAAAHYFLIEKDRSGRPIDAVARFHLGNGARLERINWLGDTSDKGIHQSFSLMVNYRYDLRDIERNHEAYVNSGVVAAAKQVRNLLLTSSKALVPAEG
jgi:malonyl-CoA decarboxylase